MGRENVWQSDRELLFAGCESLACSVRIDVGKGGIWRDVAGGGNAEVFGGTVATGVVAV